MVILVSLAYIIFSENMNSKGTKNVQKSKSMKHTVIKKSRTVQRKRKTGIIRVLLLKQLLNLMMLTLL